MTNAETGLPGRAKISFGGPVGDMETVAKVVGLLFDRFSHKLRGRGSSNLNTHTRASASHGRNEW